jgi:hypothetical protein
VRGVVFAVNKRADLFNRFFAVMILLSLFFVFVTRTISFRGDILNNFRTGIESIYIPEETVSGRFSAFGRGINTAVRDSIEEFYSYVPMSERFARTYFNFMRATNRNRYNGVTFLTDGRLMFDTMEHNIFLYERANAIYELVNYLDEGEPFLFVRVPSKLQDNSLLPIAFSDSYKIEDSEKFLQLIRGYGIDTLDLRAEMENDGIDFATAYFRGDHHWTAETAFWAFGKIAQFANEVHGFTIPESAWDPMEFDHMTFYGAFLGEESKAVNDLDNYEDITVLGPMFLTEITVTDIRTDYFGNVLIIDSFADVFMPLLRFAYYDGFTYSDLNVLARDFVRFENAYAAEHKKVLLIADSMGFPLATYFANTFSVVDQLYLMQGNNENVWSAIANNDYDLVVFVLSDGVVPFGDEDSFKDDRLYLGVPPIR